MANNYSPVFCKGVLDLKAKTIVLNVHDALVHQTPSSTVRNLVSACANMTGVSESTIYRLLRERKSGTVAPPKQSPGRTPIQIDEDVKSIIRRKVHNFYFNREIPTLDKILNAVKEDETLPNVGRKKLWRILHQLNFSWEKHNRKSMLLDRQDIIFWRRQYLRDMSRYRSEKRTIFYLDETWVNEGHSVQKIWQDNNIQSSRQAFIEGLSTGLKIPAGKGRRLIITHIGSESGFVNGGLLEFESKSTKDYHEEMTADVFEEYFEQMIELIPENSVIVLDNASYHSRLLEKLPTTSWKKTDIINWLSKKNIPFEDGMLKKELLKIVQENKSRFKKCVIDEMAKKRGIILLRLPPYHCELNPIELIWAQMKGYVARNNTTFKIKDVRELLKYSLNIITKENWKEAIKHVIKEEKKCGT